MLSSVYTFTPGNPEECRQQALEGLEDLKVYTLSLEVLCKTAEANSEQAIRMLEDSQELCLVGNSFVSALGRSVSSTSYAKADACAARIIALCKRAIDEAMELDQVVRKAATLPEEIYQEHGRTLRIALACCKAVKLLAGGKGQFGASDKAEMATLKRFARRLYAKTQDNSDNEAGQEHSPLSTSPYTLSSGADNGLGRSSPLNLQREETDAYLGWPVIARPALIEFDTGFADGWSFNVEKKLYTKLEDVMQAVSTGDMTELLPGAVGASFSCARACRERYCHLENLWVLSSYSPAGDSSHKEEQIKYSPSSAHLVLTQQQVSNVVWSELTKLDNTVEQLELCVELLWSQFDATRHLIAANTIPVGPLRRHSWDVAGLVAIETFEGIQRMFNAYYQHYVKQEGQQLWAQLISHLGVLRPQILELIRNAKGSGEGQQKLQALQEHLEAQDTLIEKQCEEIHPGLGKLLRLSSQCLLYAEGVANAQSSTLISKN